MSMDHEIVLSVTYGIGATARTFVPRHALDGCTVKEAIETAVKAPQAPGSPEERTILMIAEALRKGRQLDIEVSSGSSGGVGIPVALEEPFDARLHPAGQSDNAERTAMEQEINYSLTEPFRGGAWR